MPVKPRDLFESAKLVHAHQKNEAGNRAAISRAYYAAYHAARKFYSSLPKLGSVGTTTGLHEQLVAQLINPGIPPEDPKFYDSQSIGYELRDFHRLRVISDYDLAEKVGDDDVESALLTSKSILETCKC
jgi:hypothetical protein